MQYYPIVTLTGPRQSGKTTLVKETFPDYDYVSLEDPDMFEFATEDPRAFLANYSQKVIFDEVQNAPQILSYLQSEVDSKKSTGRFVLTGSQQFSLNEKISQSLAGRTALLRLLPLTLSEIEQRTPQTYWLDGKLNQSIQVPEHSLYTYLFQGMYPRLYEYQIPANKFYRNYVHTYLTRDLRQLLQVANMNQFLTFLRFVAGCSGQRVNLQSIGDDTGVDHTTVKRWLDVLEASYIIHLLKPHYKNFNKRLIKAPKIYFLDTGLLCYLLHIRQPDELKSHPLIGGIFETFVFTEVYKSFCHADEEPPLYYWRDQSGREIDLLIDKADTLFPLEIKSGQTITKNFFRNLEYWLNLNGNLQNEGCLAYGGNQWQRRRHIQVIPWFGLS